MAQLYLHIRYTQQNRLHLENLTVAKKVDKCPAFYVASSFTTMFTAGRH